MSKPDRKANPDEKPDKKASPDEKARTDERASPEEPETKEADFFDIPVHIIPPGAKFKRRPHKKKTVTKAKRTLPEKPKRKASEQPCPEIRIILDIKRVPSQTNPKDDSMSASLLECVSKADASAEGQLASDADAGWPFRRRAGSGRKKCGKRKEGEWGRGRKESGEEDGRRVGGM
ncbi:hypothetical protein ACOMHN_043910 [Nucella lapillus]